ncbi:hypothetical protein [Siphonobacter sp. SORGH_AS_0500]|uniref:type II toxin-antitoxin system VapC family toxin n=1 Tax=Siphonobacter sp. SORGH_AS_0500 TaxID=1864824 RepID=UPI0028623352|nr:hypothetical protein [Siphonobacter sp. SORGH_AS_0500]MDR6194424.1 PIN domain nuclease of toxin-antitoxin system [Siphonobacter sp. SORGH_AS_0500]
MPSKLVTSSVIPVEVMAPVAARTRKAPKVPKDFVGKVSAQVWQEIQPLKTDFKEPKRWPKYLLLDTPTLDYLIRDAYRLSQTAVVAINEPGITCYVSECSWLELAEKMKRDLYEINVSFGEFMNQVMTHYKLQLLPMDALALEKYRNLSALPNAASRITCGWLVAQSLAIGATLISPDGHFEAYRSQGLKQLW